MAEHDRPVIETDVLAEGSRVTCGSDLVEQPDGSERRCYWVDIPPAVVVVATVDGDVLFVDQYRPVAREAHLELPAGFVESHTDGAAHAEGTVPVDGGESFESAAARELGEETGFVPDETELLQRFALETSVMRHERAVVFADGLTRADRDLDEDEFLNVERVPVDEALDVAREQPANDITIEGLLLAEKDGFL